MANNKESVISTLNIIRQNLMESFDNERDRLNKVQDGLNKMNVEESEDLNEILKGRDEVNTPTQIFHSKLVEIQNKVDGELEELIQKIDK